jgi:hypothetical protein
MKSVLSKSLYLSLLFIATVFPVLRSLGYQNADFETLVVLGLLVVSAIFLAIILIGRPKFEKFVLSFFVYWLIDSFFPGKEVSIIFGIIGGGVAYYLLGSRQADNVSAALGTFCAVWLIGCIMQPERVDLTSVDVSQKVIPSSSTANVEKLRPILHFILDEQMSPRVAAETIPPGHPASNIIDEYVSRGFKIHTHVYSSSHKTIDSISQLLLYDASLNRKRSDNNKFEHEIIKNKHFEYLNSKGYRVSAITSTELNVCQLGYVNICRSYGPEFGHISEKYQSQYKERIVLILLALERAYNYNNSDHNVLFIKLLSNLMRVIHLGPEYNSSAAFSRPTSVLDVLDKIKIELKDLKAGDAHYFHLLIPHSPFVLSPECHINPYSEWTGKNGHANVHKKRDVIYKAYWDQSACTHRTVFDVIDAVMAEHANLKPIIVIHGDHGSRIDEAPSKDTAEMRETYFAVYREELIDKAGEYKEPVGLPAIFKKLFTDGEIDLSF